MKNIRAFIPLIILAVILALAAVPLLKGRDPTELPSVLIGKQAPATALPPALNGEGIGAGAFKTGPALVNFFASWCVTCVEEQAVLALASKELKIPVYGIDYKDKKPAVKAWLARHGNPFDAIGFDEDGRAGIDWGVAKVPETFVLDKQGVIIHKYTGAISKEEYEDHLKPLVRSLQ